MCSSFPVILNFGGAPFVERPIHSEHVAGPIVVANWDDPPKDPDKIWIDLWILEEINDKPIFFEDILPGRSPVLSFNETHTRIIGQSFCNQYAADCRLYEDQFLIGTIINERTYCEGERAFYLALASANSYRVDDGRLYLMADTSELLQFNRYESLQRQDSISAWPYYR